MILDKYTNKSSEFNIINKIENGQGRKSSTYEFDYAYCIYKEIPTHFIKNSERLDKTRSRYTGNFIKKVTKITENLMGQANLEDKVEGEIRYVNDSNEVGFVKTSDGCMLLLLPFGVYREKFLYSNLKRIEDEEAM